MRQPGPTPTADSIELGDNNKTLQERVTIDTNGNELVDLRDLRLLFRFEL